MKNVDPEAERKRLEQLYSGMSLDELEKLAESGPTLTDPAKEALRFELSRRGSKLEIRDSVVDADPSPSVVTLRRFRDIPEALLAKSILDSAGVECFLSNENTIRMDWLWSNALGGVGLLVRKEDASAASELLDQKLTESFQVDELGEYVQPQCPNCQSLDISYGERGKRLAYATVAVGIPMPVQRFGWKCNSCGHEWTELDAETEEEE